MFRFPLVKVVLEGFRNEILHHYNDHFDTVIEDIKIQLKEKLTEEYIKLLVEQEFDTCLKEVIRTNVRNYIFEFSHTKQFKELVLLETKKQLEKS